MKSFRQVLRQPIKYIAGLILMTVAAAILCICVGQALAARNTAIELDKQFTSVVLPKGEDGIKTVGDTVIVHSPVKPIEAFQTWLREMAQTHPEIVESVENHGLLSASIPELDPLNYTNGGFIAEKYSEGDRAFFNYDPETDGRPYSSAMFVFILEEVSKSIPLEMDRTITLGHPHTIKDFYPEDLYWNWVDDLGADLAEVGYTVTLSGTITDVISLQEGFRDPTGMTARLKLTLPQSWQFGEMDLEVGQSYLVYGMDYYDEDWALRSLLADERGNNLPIDSFDPSQLVCYYPGEVEKEDPEEEPDDETQEGQENGENGEEEEKEVVLKWSDFPDSKIVGRYTVTVKSAQESSNGMPVQVYLSLTAAEWRQINAISMTLSKDLHYISAEEDYRGSGSYLTTPWVDRRSEVSYKDQNGETVTMIWEEYTNRYKIPTITRLEGSVEDFLQSEEGTPWREALERDQVNQHAFAVLGTNQTMSLAWFAQQEAKITQGRDITEEEATNGARVCLIQEDLAIANGVNIGDTITLNYYRGDNGLPYQGLRDNTGDLLMPSADFYFSTTPILETAEYTVVGLWRGPDTWPDIALNEYSLSPNTVIIPKASAQAAWEHPNSVLYTTTVLHNGRIEEFRSLTRQADFYHNFLCFDQGYTELVGNFHDFEELAQQMLIVGLVVYTVILLLFLLLFPGTQGKAVATMRSLGAARGQRFNHVLLSSVAIIAPATILGGGLGLALWQRVTDALQASAESTVALQLEASTLLLIALAQFALAMALTAIIAAWITAPKSLAERRSK